MPAQIQSTQRLVFSIMKSKKISAAKAIAVMRRSKYANPNKDKISTSVKKIALTHQSDTPIMVKLAKSPQAVVQLCSNKNELKILYTEKHMPMTLMAKEIGKNLCRKGFILTP